MKFTCLSLLAAVTLTFASCNNVDKSEMRDEPSDATADTAVVYRDGETAAGVAASAADGVDNAFDMSRAELADVKLPEITETAVAVRGNEDYEVYSVDETVLFDTDKATIKPTAAKNLDQIVASIGQRFAGKQVMVMGFADSRGTANYNLELGQERASAVKSYLVEKGLPADRVNTESFGERKPEATNATPAGRQENRRVEIAVRVR